MDKLHISNEMAQFDLKNRSFYDELSEEERKKFSNFLMIRWGSAVEATQDFQEFYLIACNERLNKHFFTLNKHPKLQWLLATTVSPGMGRQRHCWIATKKKTGTSTNKQFNFLAQMYPCLKEEEIALLVELTDLPELKEQARSLGWSQDQIKRELG